MTHNAAKGRSPLGILAASLSLLLVAATANATRTPFTDADDLRRDLAAASLFGANNHVHLAARPRPAAFTLFPALASASELLWPEKLASRPTPCLLEVNVKQINEFASIQRWARESYAYVAWGPHMYTDPMGLVTSIRAETGLPADVFTTFDYESGVPILDYTLFGAFNTASNTSALVLNWGANALWAMGKAQEGVEDFLVQHTPLEPVDLQFLETYTATNPAAAPGAASYLRAKIGELFSGLRQDQRIRQLVSAFADQTGAIKLDLLLPGSGPRRSGVPSVRGGEFEAWFNSVGVEQFEELWANRSVRDAIKRRLRQPGGMHEWLLVSRANVFKRWGVKAEQIKEWRSFIDRVEGAEPLWLHGKGGSTAAHNEILEIIDTSTDLGQFRHRLAVWAEERLQGGAGALPPGLHPTQP